jgi:hypothetical protein
MTTIGGKRVRAWVVLTQGGLKAETTAERDDPLSAVVAAIEAASAQWFSVGYVTILTDVLRVVSHPSCYHSVFCYARVGDHCKEGMVQHSDVVKATALACVVAINNALAAVEAATPTA